jgi:hypothetical protein
MNGSKVHLSSAWLEFAVKLLDNEGTVDKQAMKHSVRKYMEE